MGLCNYLRTHSRLRRFPVRQKQMFLERPWQDESGDSLFFNRSLNLYDLWHRINRRNQVEGLLNLQKCDPFLLLWGR